MHIYLIEIYLTVIEHFDLTRLIFINLHIVFFLDLLSNSSIVYFVSRFSKPQGQIDNFAFQ